MLAFPILKTSAKSVQTTAEVSKKYYVLTNLSTHTYENKYTYLQKYLRVLTETSTRTYDNAGQAHQNNQVID